MVFDLFFPGYARPSCEKQKVKCSVKSAANMFCVLHLGVASSELFFMLFLRVSQFGVTLAIKGDRPVTLKTAVDAVVVLLATCYRCFFVMVASKINGRVNDELRRD